jgi:hypothetical protein
MNSLKKILENLLQWTVVVGEIRARTAKKAAWY